MQICSLESIFYLNEYINWESFYELARPYKIKDWGICRFNKAIIIRNSNISFNVMYLDIHWIKWSLRLGIEISYKQPELGWKHTNSIQLFLLYIHKCLLLHSNNYNDCWIRRYNWINQFRIYLYNDCWIYWTHILLIP